MMLLQLGMITVLKCGVGDYTVNVIFKHFANLMTPQRRRRVFDRSRSCKSVAGVKSGDCVPQQCAECGTASPSNQEN